jgi:hypothetical protein
VHFRNMFRFSNACSCRVSRHHRRFQQTAGHFVIFQELAHQPVTLLLRQEVVGAVSLVVVAEEPHRGPSPTWFELWTP